MVALVLLAALAQEPPSAIERGREALQRGEHRRAQALFELALGSAPNDPDALAGLGTARGRQGDYPWGLELLLEARRRGARDPAVLLELGRAYYMLERPLDALEPLEAFVQAAPQHAEGRQLQGLCLEFVPDLERAASAFERSLELGTPTPDMALFHLARIYRRLDRREQEETIQRRLREEHPDSPYARVDLEQEVPASDPWTRLRQMRREKPWYVHGLLEVQFDTNPLALGEDAVVPPSLIDREAWGLLASAGGGVTFALGEEARLGLDGRTQRLWRDELAPFDLHQAVVSPWGEIDWTDWLSTGLSAGGRRVDLGGDHVLDEWSGGLWITAREALWTRTRLDAGYSHAEYFFDALPRPLDPDQQTRRISLHQEILVPDTRFGLVLGGSYADRESDGSDFDSASHSAVLRVGHPLLWDIRASVTAQRTWTRHRHGSAREFASPRRHDEVSHLRVKVERPMTDWMTLYLQYSLTDNESNLGTFNYDQNVWAAGLEFLY